MTEEMVKGLRESLGRLNVQRQSLEMESEAIVEELLAVPESGGAPMGIDTPLVDGDGYPRGDIDLYRARDLRHRLAVIRTDHKKLMQQIEQLLAQLAAIQNPTKAEEEAKELESRKAPKPKPKYDPTSGKWVVKNWDGTVAGVEHGEKRSFDTLNNNNNNSNDSTSSAATLALPNPMNVDTTTTTATIDSIPFAKVDGVSPLSPAHAAGLEEGDLIVEFGSTVNHTNHDHLRALMPIVASAADTQQAIPIVLVRKQPLTAKTSLIQVKLVPQPWPGRGLIGCHIVPYTPP